MTRQAVVYAIRNRLDGKVYIGKTVDASKRFSDHRAKLCAGDHANAHLQRAWGKYGEDSFAFEIVETVPTESAYDPILNERERYWIGFLRANTPEAGYNLTDGGDGGRQVPSVRSKMSRAAKARFSIAGERQRQGDRRKHYFENHPEFKAECIANITSPKSHAKARSIVRERCRVDPEFSKRMASPLNTPPKPVNQYTIEGHFLRRFESMADAERWLGKKRAGANISTCARGRRNYAYGYKWGYADEEVDANGQQGQAV